MERKRTLILCTGNSARSQMAEGLLRRMAGERMEVFSAGTRPSLVRPEAEAVMAELGIDLGGHWSKSVDLYRNETFDSVIPVCDNAQESCPIFPGPASGFIGVLRIRRRWRGMRRRGWLRSGRFGSRLRRDSGSGWEAPPSTRSEAEVDWLVLLIGACRRSGEGGEATGCETEVWDGLLDMGGAAGGLRRGGWSGAGDSGLATDGGWQGVDGPEFGFCGGGLLLLRQRRGKLPPIWPVVHLGGGWEGLPGCGRGMATAYGHGVAGVGYSVRRGECGGRRQGPGRLPGASDGRGGEV